MKKIVLTLVGSLIMSMSMYGQKQVTKFMGIPVDGFKKEMIQKLQAKGFEYDKNEDLFTGEFNGEPVIIFVNTNNNKVYRIAVADQSYRDEAQIKIRFNTLCNQFKNNDRYTSLVEDQTISEETDLSYEMSVNEKTFEALFYQKLNDADTLVVREQVKEKMIDYYETNPLDANVREKITDEQYAKMKDMIIEAGYKMALQKIQNNFSVWFHIFKDYSRYRLIIFYDNEYNKANGEDL